MAASSVAVGGMAAACGSNDTPGEALARTYCEYYAECDPGDFNDYYDSISECVAENSDYTDEYIDDLRDEGVSSRCINAIVDLAKCGFERYDRRECEIDDVVCEQEEEAVYDACEDEDFRRGARLGARIHAAR